MADLRYSGPELLK